MKLEQDLTMLAGRVGEAERRGQPFLLVLGAACAEAAKVPTLRDLASSAGTAVRPSDRRIIERLLWSVPVPSFYQDLANLARAGMFPVIFTTGYDNLVERALYDLGLRAGLHFDTLDLAGGEASPPGADAPRGIRIVHGPEGGETPIDPTRLAEALGRSPDGAPLDLVVVGYRSESRAFDVWLQAQPAGELWWVSHEAVQPPRWAGEAGELTGGDAAPETFFGKLALLLLRPSPDADAGATYASSFEPLTSSGDDALDEAFARGQLDRARAVKGSIEQRVSSVGADPAAAMQLDYQARQIAELEQRLAKKDAGLLLERMSAFRARLAEAVDDPSSQADPETLQFVDAQIEILGREAARDVPNRAIVAATQGAFDGLVRQVGPRLDRGREAS